MVNKVLFFLPIRWPLKDPDQVYPQDAAQVRYIVLKGNQKTFNIKPKKLPMLPKEEKMDDKNEEIVKEINTLLLTLTGYPEDSKDKSGFRVFTSFTGYFYEKMKAIEKENRDKLYSKKVDSKEDQF